MVRALFVNQYYWPDLSATAQHLADLAEQLVELGFEVDVLCSQGEYESTGSKLPLIELYKGVGIRRLPAWGNRGRSVASRILAYGGFHLHSFRWIARHGSQYDIVITLTEPPLIGLCSFLSRAKHVYWCMDLYTDCLFALGSLRRSAPLGWLLESMNRVELQHADTVVALGECMRDRLVRKGIAPERIKMIGVWNRADQLWPSPIRSNRLREEHGLSEKFVVMYSGNAGRSHSFGAIRHAMQSFRDDPRVVFLYVGGGKRIAEIETFVEIEKLSNFMKLPYFPREVLNESLGMGDVHLVSLHEQMDGVVVPSKLYGAFAVGRPVLYVGPQTSTIAHDIKTANAGYSFANDDGPGLVQAIKQLKNSPEECQRLGANGREFFLRTHERRVCGEQWAAVLRGLAS